MIGVLLSSRSPKGAVVATALELLLCNPREVSFKEECPSSALWEPRMLQRLQLVSRPCKSLVLELLLQGLRCLQPVGDLTMIPTAAEPPSQSCPGCRDPLYRTSLGPTPPVAPE